MDGVGLQVTQTGEPVVRVLSMEVMVACELMLANCVASQV